MSSDIHSFIVRVWKEGVDRMRNAAVWRCSIDNVISGQRHYLGDLEEIGPFIREQVEPRAKGLPAGDDGRVGLEGP